ncbi:V-type ATP synthase subunit F [Candidatus Micrarchaeota archaeon]|nr:V-type ATP synthase subunit F [Candidatus Micrarchaeota archaeon]
MKIFVLADKPTCIGFRLAGVENCHVAEGKDAERKLEELMNNEDVGVIVVNEKLLAQIDWKLKKKIDTTARPAVVPVPDKHGPSSEVESLGDMIKKALGFELIK